MRPADADVNALASFVGAAAPEPGGPRPFIFSTTLVRLPTRYPVETGCGCCGEPCSRMAALVAIDAFDAPERFLLPVCSGCARRSDGAVMTLVARRLDPRAEGLMLGPEGRA